MEGGDWTSALGAPPELPAALAEDATDPGLAAMAALALHLVLGILSTVAIMYHAFGWLDAIVHAVFAPHVQDPALYGTGYRNPIREEASKLAMLGLGALVLASFRPLRLEARLFPILLVPALGIGLGFAVLETRLDGGVATGGDFLVTAVWRVMGHSLCVAWSAVGVALAARRRWWWAAPLGLLVAMAIHMGNNVLHLGHPFLWARAGTRQTHWLIGWTVAWGAVAAATWRDLNAWPPSPRPNSGS